MVHRALPGDAGLMAAIHASCFDRPSDRPWDEAAMAQLIASPGVLCLLGAATHVVAAPAGLLIARRAADEAELLTLGVTPACRRSGLGRALVTKALEDLRASGAATLFLEVDEGNEAALALYRSFGAQPVGRAPDITRAAPTPRSSALPFQTGPPMMGKSPIKSHEDQR
ncbi:hypothetical protein AUC69_06180 [Methyloceanibacter superfactus]|uniref:N-acetyltransferase domain-containing protein n=1 Tax=Methyloceanibacter superfactus TaxID=1774969 RepID=A0A1E3W7N0_9HYPH|nr:N-acetyltransferase [Methyloceanibacter superfactus]ODS01813.1 hypothetical protein AUC69_06180 [Methyloceanibacter superfactus]